MPANQAASHKTLSATEILLEALPYASDAGGVFRSGDAQAYLKSFGFTAGTSAATIFKWSDPTDRIGYRRFRRTQRDNAVQAPEAAFFNSLSGKMPIKGWKSAAPARNYAASAVISPVPVPAAPVAPTPTPAQAAVDLELPTPPLRQSRVEHTARDAVTLATIAIVISIFAMSLAFGELMAHVIG